MALVKIFRGHEIIATEKFERNFFILADLTGSLFWDMDEAPRSRPGEFKVWVQHADTDPGILYILPDWKFKLDGVPQKQRFYDTVKDLKGRTVELIHDQYTFLFHF